MFVKSKEIKIKLENVKMEGLVFMEYVNVYKEHLEMIAVFKVWIFCNNQHFNQIIYTI